MGFSQKNHIISEPVTSPFHYYVSLSDQTYHSPASLFQPWRGHKDCSISSAFHSKSINFSFTTKLHHIEYSQNQWATTWVSNSSYYRRNFHHEDIGDHGIWPLVKQPNRSGLPANFNLHVQGTQMAGPSRWDLTTFKKPTPKDPRIPRTIPTHCTQKSKTN